MDLRQFLHHRSRNPLKNPLKLYITENLVYHANPDCPHAVKGQVHKHENRYWFIKQKMWTNVAYKIQYRHIMCACLISRHMLEETVILRNPPSLTSIAAASLLTYGKLNVHDPGEYELAANIIEQCENIMFFGFNSSCLEVSHPEWCPFDNWVDENWEENGFIANIYGHKVSRNNFINIDISNRGGKFNETQIFFPAPPIGTLFLKGLPVLNPKDNGGRTTVVGVESNLLPKTKRMRTHL